jgi:hypothetical protein
MTHREVSDGAIPRDMPRLMRQAAVTENTLFLLWLESKEVNGAEAERTKRLALLRLKAFSRFFRRAQAR